MLSDNKARKPNAKYPIKFYLSKRILINFEFELFDMIFTLNGSEQYLVMPPINIFKNFMGKCSTESKETCETCDNGDCTFMKCCRCKNIVCFACSSNLKNRSICNFCKFSMYDLIIEKENKLV